MFNFCCQPMSRCWYLQRPIAVQKLTACCEQLWNNNLRYVSFNQFVAHQQCCGFKDGVVKSASAVQCLLSSTKGVYLRLGGSRLVIVLNDLEAPLALGLLHLGLVVLIGI